MIIDKRKEILLQALNSEVNVTIGDEQYQAKVFYPNNFTLVDQHELWLDAAYKAALHAKKGAFIDVGTNTGQTLIKILSIDKNREYVGFEPQLDCCFYIDQFIKQNNLTNHTLLPVGLSNQTELLQLLKRKDGTDCAASTIKGFRPDDFYTTKQSIYVVKGDDIIPAIDLQQISTIKIDVEGGELEVIDGLKNTLSEHSPFVFFEVLNHFLAITGHGIDSEMIEFRESRNRQMEDILREMNYRIFNILPDDRLIEITEIKPKVSGDLRITDYVAVHSDNINSFINNFEGTFAQEAV